MWNARIILQCGIGSTGLEALTPQQQGAHLVPRSWFLKYSFPLKEAELLGKMVICMVGA